MQSRNKSCGSRTHAQITVNLKNFNCIEELFRALIILKAVQNGEYVRRIGKAKKLTKSSPERRAIIMIRQGQPRPYLRCQESVIDWLCAKRLIKCGAKGQFLPVRDRLDLRVVV